MATPAKTWGVSTEERDLIERRAATRLKLRKEYQRQLFSPYVHGTGEGGYVFDPMVQRYISLKSNYINMFKPTLKTGIIAFSCVMVPILGMYYIVSKDRRERMAELAEGKVAYADRRWKLVSS